MKNLNPSSPIDIIEGDLDYMKPYNKARRHFRRAGIKLVAKPSPWPAFTKATNDWIEACKEYTFRSLLRSLLKNPFSFLKAEQR